MDKKPQKQCTLDVLDEIGSCPNPTLPCEKCFYWGFVEPSSPAKEALADTLMSAVRKAGKQAKALYATPQPEPSMPLIELPKTLLKQHPLDTDIASITGFKLGQSAQRDADMAWLPAHDLAVRKALIEEVCKLLDDELRIVSPNTEANLKAHIRAMAEGVGR